MGARCGEREDSRKALCFIPQGENREGCGEMGRGKRGASRDGDRLSKEPQGPAAYRCQESEPGRREELPADQGFPSTEEGTWAPRWPPPKAAQKRT